jgi:hypothetical protein
LETTGAAANRMAEGKSVISDRCFVAPAVLGGAVLCALWAVRGGLDFNNRKSKIVIRTPIRVDLTTRGGSTVGSPSKKFAILCFFGFGDV